MVGEGTCDDGVMGIEYDPSDDMIGYVESGPCTDRLIHAHFVENGRRESFVYPPMHRFADQADTLADHATLDEALAAVAGPVRWVDRESAEHLSTRLLGEDDDSYAIPTRRERRRLEHVPAADAAALQAAGANDPHWRGERADGSVPLRVGRTSTGGWVVAHKVAYVSWLLKLSYGPEVDVRIFAAEDAPAAPDAASDPGTGRWRPALEERLLRDDHDAMNWLAARGLTIEWFDPRQAKALVIQHTPRSLWPGGPLPAESAADRAGWAG